MFDRSGQVRAASTTAPRPATWPPTARSARIRLTCGYVDLRTQNLGGTSTNGVDLSATYRMTHRRLWASYNFHLNSTYVHKYEYQNSEGGEWHQNVGVYSGTGPVFRWQNNFVRQLDTGLRSGPACPSLQVGLPGLAGRMWPTMASIRGSWWRRTRPWTSSCSWAADQGFVGPAWRYQEPVRSTPPCRIRPRHFRLGYDPRFTDPTGRTLLRARYLHVLSAVGQGVWEAPADRAAPPDRRSRLRPSSGEI